MYTIKNEIAKACLKCIERVRIIQNWNKKDENKQEHKAKRFD